MKIAIPKEVYPEERRVAATPATVEKLIEAGFSVAVERGAGALASYTDAAYAAAGATVVDNVAQLWADADIVFKVRAPQTYPAGSYRDNDELPDHEAELLTEKHTLVSFIWPAQNPELVELLKKSGATVLAMDQVPRISRAQKLDALSSMANIAGYRAVVEAAYHFGRFFTGQITAAGRVMPPKVLVIGAGVAGLAAIGDARRLGAVVRAFDTRAAVKDEVKSLGGEFLELDFEESGDGGGGYAKVMSKEFIEAEMALFREQAKEIDIVITTALIPGRPAPKLWLADMVEAMPEGGVIVDLAAEQGGNCELTEPGEVVVKHGVTLIGLTDFPSRLATTSSQLYATNLTHLMKELGSAEGFVIDHDNVVTRQMLVTEKGEVMWPPPKLETPAPKPAPKPAEPTPEPAVAVAAAAEPESKSGLSMSNLVLGSVTLLLAGVWAYLRLSGGGAGEVTEGVAATAHFVQHLTVFVLACFVGWQVVWSVTAALHTPLMSVTNAISGIIILGGLLHTKSDMSASAVLGALAILLATINIAGGFLVTQRMLRMFRK